MPRGRVTLATLLYSFCNALVLLSEYKKENVSSLYPIICLFFVARWVSFIIPGYKQSGKDTYTADLLFRKANQLTYIWNYYFLKIHQRAKQDIENKKLKEPNCTTRRERRKIIYNDICNYTLWWIGPVFFCRPEERAIKWCFGRHPSLFVVLWRFLYYSYEPRSTNSSSSKQRLKNQRRQTPGNNDSIQRHSSFPYIDGAPSQPSSEKYHKVIRSLLLLLLVHLHLSHSYSYIHLFFFLELFWLLLFLPEI